MINFSTSTARILFVSALLSCNFLLCDQINAAENKKVDSKTMQQMKSDREFIVKLVKSTVITLSQEEQKVLNYTKAFKNYQSLVDRGDARAIYPLGFCHQYGLGTKVNVKKAIELYKMLQRNVESDIIKAKALLQLASLYLEKDTKKDTVQAVYDIGAAITFNYPDAYSMFAELTFNGRGLTQSIPKAMKYLEVGAKNKSGACLYKLGKIAGKGLYNQHKDPVKELEYYQKSAALNNGDGLVALAKYYYGAKSLVRSDKLVIKPDLEKASELLQKAVRYDISKYPELVKIFESVDDVAARGLISTTYFLQQLVKLDPDNQRALLELGKCYLMGYGVKKDANIGVRILEILVSRDNIHAEKYLAHYYSEGLVFKFGNNVYTVAKKDAPNLDPKRAFDIYHHLADTHNMCNYELAKFYFSGVGGNEISEEQGLKYVVRALSSRQDTDKVFDLLSSYYGLPQYYATDERSIATKPTGKMANRTIAIVDKYLKNNPNDFKAFKYLANIYFYGVGVKKNYQRFTFTLNVAFMRGDQAAGNALITTYLTDVGVKANSAVALQKAKEYFDRPMHSSNEIIDIIDKFAKYDIKKLPALIKFIKGKADAKEKYFAEAMKYCAEKGYTRKYKIIE